MKTKFRFNPEGYLQYQFEDKWLDMTLQRNYNIVLNTSLYSIVERIPLIKGTVFNSNILYNRMKRDDIDKCTVIAIFYSLKNPPYLHTDEVSVINMKYDDDAGLSFNLEIKELPEFKDFRSKLYVDPHEDKVHDIITDEVANIIRKRDFSQVSKIDYHKFCFEVLHRGKETIDGYINVKLIEDKKED